MNGIRPDSLNFAFLSANLPLYNYPLGKYEMVSFIYCHAYRNRHRKSIK